MLATPMAEDIHAKREAAARERDTKIEYGRTVDDARRLSKRAKSIYLWVRRGLYDDALIIEISPAAFRVSTKHDRGADPMPCHFDPENNRLDIGSIGSIYKARDAAS